MAVTVEALQRILDVRAQAAFGEPLVELDPEAGKVLLDISEDGIECQVEHPGKGILADQLASALYQPVDMGFLVTAVGFVSRDALEDGRARTLQGVALVLAQLAGNGQDIVAPIAIGGEGECLPTLFEVAEPDTERQDAHLAASVVDVIFAVYVVADGFEQVRDAGPVGGAPTVTHVQRAGGVGGDEFHLHRFTLSQVLPAESAPLFPDGAQNVELAGAADEEIDEPRTGNFHFVDGIVAGQG